MKKCKRVINKYLQSADEKIPFSIKLHVFFCEDCHREIESLQTVFQQLQDTTSFHSKKDFTNDIMGKVKSMPPIECKPQSSVFVSLSKWLLVGALLVCSVLVLPYNQLLSWESWYFTQHFQITLYIIMGLATSAYVALFTIAHIEEIKKYTKYLE